MPERISEVTAFLVEVLAPRAPLTVIVDGGEHGAAASFAADGFLNPRRIEFEVRMSPLEAEWSTTRLRPCARRKKSERSAQ